MQKKNQFQQQSPTGRHVDRTTAYATLGYFAQVFGERVR